LRFLKGDLVFPLILSILPFVPFESNTTHMYSVRITNSEVKSIILQNIIYYL
jgi:hypothetical protein